MRNTYYYSIDVPSRKIIGFFPVGPEHKVPKGKKKLIVFIWSFATSILHRLVQLPCLYLYVRIFGNHLISLAPKLSNFLSITWAYRFNMKSIGSWIGRCCRFEQISLVLDILIPFWTFSSHKSLCVFILFKSNLVLLFHI